jgi:chaperonin GroEL
MGVKIIREVLEAPIVQIAKNAGFKSDIWVENILTGKSGWGYDARTGEFVDMHEAGIIDPAKVTRSAFENAASIASMVLTTEVMIADEPEPPTPSMPHMMHDM